MPVSRALLRSWTEEEFYAARDAAPPGDRWELVNGWVLVTPSPHRMHQRPEYWIVDELRMDTAVDRS